jgi:hypothetical protein
MNWQKFTRDTLVGRKITKVTKKNITVDGKKYSNVFVIHLDNKETITQFSNNNRSNYLMVSNRYEGKDARR